MAYTLDQESLRFLGVPEKFEPLFDNVFQGDEGGIYAAYGELMHLLVQDSKAYPIVPGKAELPDDLAEMRKKIYAPTKAGDKIRTMFGIHKKRKNKDFAFVAESRASLLINKVFIKSENAYSELPEQNFSCIDGPKILIAGGALMVKKDQTFMIIDFVPIFESSSGMIFWGGDKDLIEATFEGGELYINYFGRFKKFIQTAVSNLVETVIDENNFIDYFGKDLQNLGMSELEDSFKIDNTTGTIVSKSNTCFDDHVVIRTFVYKDGRYEKKA